MHGRPSIDLSTVNDWTWLATVSLEFPWPGSISTGSKKEWQAQSSLVGGFDGWSGHQGMLWSLSKWPKQEKQPEVHRSTLPKAECPLLEVPTRSRSPKRPDLAGEITKKSLTLKSDKTFSWWIYYDQPVVSDSTWNSHLCLCTNVHKYLFNLYSMRFTSKSVITLVKALSVGDLRLLGCFGSPAPMFVVSLHPKCQGHRPYTDDTWEKHSIGDL